MKYVDVAARDYEMNARGVDVKWWHDLMTCDDDMGR